MAVTVGSCRKPSMDWTWSNLDGTRIPHLQRSLQLLLGDTGVGPHLKHEVWHEMYPAFLMGIMQQKACRFTQANFEINTICPQIPQNMETLCAPVKHIFLGGGFFKHRRSTHDSRFHPGRDDHHDWDPPDLGLGKKTTWISLSQKETSRKPSLKWWTWFNMIQHDEPFERCLLSTPTPPAPGKAAAPSGAVSALSGLWAVWAAPWEPGNCCNRPSAASICLTVDWDVMICRRQNRLRNGTRTHNIYNI